MLLVLHLTLLYVALGMALFQCFVPRAALGPGFGKTISASIFFCLLPAVILTPLAIPNDGNPARTALMFAGIGGLAIWFLYFTVLNYKAHERQLGRIAIAGSLTLLIMLVAISRLLADRFYMEDLDFGFDPAWRELLFVSLVAGGFSASMLLGSVTMAMLIGHWYLVIQGLSIRWLKGACLVFGVSIFLKLIAMGISFSIGAMGDPFGPQGFMDRVIWMNSMLFFARTVVGIVIPALLCFMAYRAAAINSTQSSTGILFPAMVIVFLGEMIGIWLIIGMGGLYV